MQEKNPGIRKRKPDRVSGNRLLIALLFIAILTLATPRGAAQVYTGSVTGVVTDPSGAVIPGAAVTLVDAAKGFPYSTVSDSVGRYVLRNLLPGMYTLKVEAKGFKVYTQTGITLAVQQNATLDVALEMGATAQEVSVTAAAPLLAAQDAVTGQVVNRVFMDDLPLIGRNGYDLVLLAPGAVPVPTVITGFLSGGGNSVGLDGMRNMSAEELVDGVPTTGLILGVKTQLYSPSIDDIQEFAVQSNNFSADTGHSGSTVIVVVTRSGTNRFHGNAYDYFRNQVMDSNGWFNNANRVKIPPLRYNDFGGTFGGPIQKDKTFFFASYEGPRLRTFQSFLAGVPSAAERTGDFSELCGYNGGTFNASGQCSAAKGQLWDPYSGNYSASVGGPVRGTFIPFNNMAVYQSPGSPLLAGTPYQRAAKAGNLIDPVASKMMQYYPLPNSNVGAASYNPYNNWVGSGVNVTDTNQLDARIDRRINDRMQVNGKWGHNWSPQELAKAFGNPMEPFDNGPASVGSTVALLNLTRNISSNTLLSFTYGFTRGGWYTGLLAKEFPDYNPITTLGLPSYMLTAGVPSSPFMTISDYAMAAPGLSSLGEEGWTYANVARQVHDMLASLDTIRGKHEIKAGFELQIHQENYYSPTTPMGNFSFNRYGTSMTPASGTGGDALATFLTGTSTQGSASYGIATPYLETAPMWSGYVQDKWRVTSKLTLNLGLRYDLDQSPTERHNRIEHFDPTIASPLTVPGLPNLRGGDVYATPSDRRLGPVFKKEFQPRFGFAYRATSNTVLRGGYGIFFNPFMGPGIPGQDGYSASTSWQTTYQYDLSVPGPPFSDPWPGPSIILPTGNSRGALTNVGLTASGFLAAWNKVGYTQAWNFGIQRELRGGILIEANYVGNKATNLSDGSITTLNYLPPSVEQLTPAQISSTLAAKVANPFSGIITLPTSSLSPATIPAWRLLVPYPQFSGMGLSPAPRVNARYQAFQLKFEKRFSQGLQFLASYTNSKALDQGSANSGGNTHYGGWLHLQDPNNLGLEWGLSAYDLPQALKLTYVCQLPFGKGKRWGGNWNRWADGLLGGWQTNGNWMFDDGFPMLLAQSGGSAIPTYGSLRPNLSAPLQRNHGADWMKNYFANPQVATAAPSYTLGTAPPTIPNVRQPGTRNASLSLFKEFPLTSWREEARLQFRLESFNALNHPQFFGPNTTVASGVFGVISSQRNSPREVQLALKLYW
jgi:Carboxypeptidase regulatory-like domain